MGVVVGLILGRMVRLAEVVDPFITAFYSLPKLALAPLFILWLGIGMDMKIVFTATIVFFLVFLNTYTGVRNVSRELVAILRLMGANERHVLTKVIIPRRSPGCSPASASRCPMPWWARSSASSSPRTAASDTCSRIRPAASTQPACSQPWSRS